MSIKENPRRVVTGSVCTNHGLGYLLALEVLFHLPHCAVRDTVQRGPSEHSYIWLLFHPLLEKIMFHSYL